MNLPKLETLTYKVKVDEQEIELREPNLDQVQKISSYKEISNEDDAITVVASTLASLMDSYNETIAEKEAFIRSLSVRQIDILVSGITDMISKKKIETESVK